MNIGIARALVLAAMLALPAVAAANERGEAAWAAVRAQLFGERPIADGSHLMEVEAPYRAADAALVPVTIRDRRDSAGAPVIRRLYLVVDNNPVPLTGIFEFGPAAASATIATRIRINAYTNVRAIAETADGRLYMAKSYVKASGGCTAPAGVAEEEALQDLGEMRARTWSGDDGEGIRVQLGIRHPNFSGMQMNQVTRLYRPAYHITDVRVRYAGQDVLSAKLTIGISRNPSLRFYVSPNGDGRELVVAARDNEGHIFEKSFAIDPEMADVNGPRHSR